MADSIDDPTTREGLEALAAEYALGLSGAEDRDSAALRMGREATFRHLVGMWEMRLADLNTGFGVLPAPDVWPALDRQLFAPARRARRVIWLLIAIPVVAVAVKVVAFLALSR